MLKKWKKSLCVILAAILLLGCTGCGTETSDSAADEVAFEVGDYEMDVYQPTDEEVSYAPPGGGKNNRPPAVPDPARALSGEKMTLTEDVELTVDGEVFIFDCYTYTFKGSNKLGSSSESITYRFLLEDVGLSMERLGGRLGYSEYMLLWGNSLVGFLTTNNGRWELYVPASIGINSNSNSDGGGKTTEPYKPSGSFQNESFGIEVRPGESSGGGKVSATKCDACKGTGKCSGCGGDGYFDNPYLGKKNTKRCTLCDKTGDCSVCEGEGVWTFD